jgi:hypothetical protein
MGDVQARAVMAIRECSAIICVVSATARKSIVQYGDGNDP